MIYGVSPGLQKKEIETYCLPCGKIRVGFLLVEEFVFAPCLSDECPYEEQHSEVLGTDQDNEDFCIRKLIPLDKKNEQRDSL